MNKKNEILRAFKSLVPEIVFKRIQEGKKIKAFEILDLSFLYADISGFTRMSERLSKYGREGAEELTKIINKFFSKLIEIIKSFKGDIYGFGGDAIFAFFEGKNKEKRALECAIAMMNFVNENKKIKKFKYTFRIGMHTGIATGKVFFKDFGTDDFMGGKTLRIVSQIVSETEKGNIALCPNTVKKLKEFDFSKKKRIYFLKRLKKIKIPETQTDKIKYDERIFNELKGYIPDFIIERLGIKPFFEPRDGEHRKVTNVFIYLAGFDFDKKPLYSAKLLEKFYKVLKENCKIYGGYVNKFDIADKGERVFITFGFPRAMEDDEIRAINFCYEILNDEGLKDIDLRIGVNSGYVFAGPVGSELRSEFTVMGDAVNLAARLASKAKKGEILISEQINKKIERIFETERKGRIKFKGKVKEISVFRVKKKRAVRIRMIEKWVSESAIMVGRNEEVKEIKEIIKKVKNRKGQIVFITGEAGIGKSRLARELVNLCLKENLKVFEGDCISYGSSFSYHPWAQILNDFFEISPIDDVETKKKKITDKVSKINKKLKEWLPVIGEPLGITFPQTSLTKFIDAKLKKQRIFDLTFDFLKYEAKRHPVCIVIEDLQWADSTSIELLNYIARNIENRPIILTLVSRPLPERQEFMEKKWFTPLKLKELSEDDTMNLIKNLLDVKELPEHLKKLIFQKSQGNPFYIEEIIKSLIEAGFIVLRKGKWYFKGEIKKVKLPDRVEGVIMSRIDRLDYRTKDVLQVASVLGREFDEFLIKGIYPDVKFLPKALKDLNSLDLVRIERKEGSAKYFFKHILTQEVAYNSISFERRRALHLKVGEFIEENFKDRKEEFLGILSHHFYNANDWERALFYSVEAGEKAKKVYANYEAIEFFTRAIESYEKMEEEEK